MKVNTGKPLASKTIPSIAIGWSVKRQAIHPDVTLQKGNRYCIVLHSAANKSSYGYTYTSGKNQNKLNYKLIISPIKPLGRI